MGRSEMCIRDRAAAGSANITINVNGNAASDGAALTTTMPITVPIVQPELSLIHI